MDIVAGGLAVVEVKAAEKTLPDHEAQLVTIGNIPLCFVHRACYATVMKSGVTAMRRIVIAVAALLLAAGSAEARRSGGSSQARDLLGRTGRQ
jgi:hypothetical protein